MRSALWPRPPSSQSTSHGLCGPSRPRYGSQAAVAFAGKGGDRSSGNSRSGAKKPITLLGQGPNHMDIKGSQKKDTQQDNAVSKSYSSSKLNDSRKYDIISHQKILSLSIVRELFDNQFLTPFLNRYFSTFLLPFATMSICFTFFNALR